MSNTLSTKKNRNLLTDTDMLIIDKIDRTLLFPFTEKIDIINKLPTPARKTVHAPKPMNTFMVFRRYLNIFVKENMPSYDGKNLSRVAGYLWNKASKEDKQGYVEITKL